MSADNSAYRLGSDQIHIWSFQHPSAISDRGMLLSWLSKDEASRADRFCSAELQDRFLLSRAFLRALLGSYLQIDPKEVRFSYGPYGKPELVQPNGSSNSYTFSVAHSAFLTLCAVALERELGVDLEQVRTINSISEMVARFFSKEEIEALRLAAPAQAHEAFFRGWTAKEAFVKATGEGLNRSFDSFVVSLSPTQSLSIVRVDDSHLTASEWTIWELHPAQGFTAALVAKAKERLDISLRHWTNGDFLPFAHGRPGVTHNSSSA